MPTVQDMLSMAELLKTKSIEVDEDRCVRVRNRNSTCEKCTDACIRDAISTGKNEVVIDSDVCVNCGACVAVCPADALIALEPTEGEVANRLAEASKFESGMVVIACSRKASHHEADPADFAELPCLGHVNETMLLEVVKAGIDDIVLVDGCCESCKYGSVSPLIDETLEDTARILEACDSEAILTRTSKFPEELIANQSTSARNVRGQDRRGLLFQTGGYVRRVATNVAKKTIEDKLGASDKPRTLQERLGAGKSGRMPTYEPYRNFQILDAMEAIGKKKAVCVSENDVVVVDESVVDDSDVVLDTRHFGSVAIDAQKCSGCGLCVLFCPTEALSHAEFDTPDDESKKYLEFQSSLCTQCRLCEDVCIRKCLNVSSRVCKSDLFDFEPELIEISKPQERASILDFRNRTKDK